MTRTWYNKDMNDKEKQAFKSLLEKVESLEQKLSDDEKGNYTQKEVFTNTVVFKQPVYDKFGTKIMN